MTAQPARWKGVPVPRKVNTDKRSSVEARRASRFQKREAEVVSAAADIFYERGYASATVQDVADALGLLKGSLYYYIESKEDLLYRLMGEIHDGVDVLLDEISAAEDL